jgi:hypothetical protein
VSYSASASGPWTAYSDNSIESEIVDGLSPGNTYYFQVSAAACDGTSSTGDATAKLATQNAAQTCSYSGFAVTPTSATIDSNDKLSSVANIQFSVNVTSGCSSVGVTYSPVSKTTDTDLGPAGSGTLTWNASATKWSAGTITFYLQINGSDVGTPQQVQITCSTKNC